MCDTTSTLLWLKVPRQRLFVSLAALQSDVFLIRSEPRCASAVQKCKHVVATRCILPTCVSTISCINVQISATLVKTSSAGLKASSCEIQWEKRRSASAGEWGEHAPRGGRRQNTRYLVGDTSEGKTPCFWINSWMQTQTFSSAYIHVMQTNKKNGLS